MQVHSPTSTCSMLRENVINLSSFFSALVVLPSSLMAFSSWFSRFNKQIYRTLNHSSLNPYRSVTSLTTESINSNRHNTPFSWSNSVIPLALAVSAGSLALDSQRNTSFCDSSVGANPSNELVVEGSPRRVPQEFIDELKAICQDNMTMDYEDRYFHGKPQNSFHEAVNIPDVVVLPRSEEEVAKIVTSCNKYKVPIVPYGGATSVEGHTLAPYCGVCIDMSLMKNVKALRVEDMDVVVEPGIGYLELNEYLEPYGLFFPLDPGPGASIGGMCATRCSGSLAVREIVLSYESTKKWHMELGGPGIIHLRSDVEDKRGRRYSLGEGSMVGLWEIRSPGFVEGLTACPGLKQHN